jgi:hypothetical protein
MNQCSDTGSRVPTMILVIVGYLSFLLLGLISSQSQAAAPPASGQEIAVVGATQGDAKVQRAGEAQFKKIPINSPLFLMDFLETGRNSKLWWKGTNGGSWLPFPEVTHGSLGEHTLFGFAGFQRTGSAVTFVGQVNTGIVRFIKKLHPTDPPSAFIIVTPTARIEVIPTDRAADSMVETVKESRTTVTVLWGKVKVRNISEQFKEERILTSCQEVDVEKDKEPGEIRWVSTDTMKNLLKRTTIPNTLPTDVPSCERVRTEVIERPGRVHVPPAGAIVVPLPIPIPVPVPGGKTDGCPCPPGSYMDPATNQCACCPQGRLYSADKCGCACPCPPNYQYDPRGQGCVPCRDGATYDPITCRCACPCPQGQFLLPGRGCVPECPEGYSPSTDTSTGVPHQCPVCVQDPVVKSEKPPCGEERPCGLCETCTQGNCVRKTCSETLVLNLLNCECQPLIPRYPTDCQGNGDCSACQQCREGKCVSVITCTANARLNLRTCQCEPVEVSVLSLTGSGAGPTGCQSDGNCPSGEMCKNGKCVKRPPPRERESSTIQEDPFAGMNGIGRTQGSRTLIPGIGIGVGGGGGGGGGGGAGGARTPVRTPLRVK